jgi:hypothetical protein
MFYFFDILKISSVIEPLNSYWTDKAVFMDDDRQKPVFSQVPTLENFRLVMYCDASKFRKTEFQQDKLFALPDKKQYKTKFTVTVISLLRFVNSNLEILLIRKTFLENDVIKWLPAFSE